MDSKRTEELGSSSSPALSYQTALSADVAGADLLASAFIAALTNSRRCTLALPFPAEHFPRPANSLEPKDFEGVLRAVEALPPLRSLLPEKSQSSSEPSTSTTPPDIPACCHLLLGWILAPTTRRQTSLRHISMQQLHTQLQRTRADFRLPDGPPPTYIFENLHGNSTALSDPVIAFHGTAFESLHSILCTGLQPGSGRLLVNGAIFGNGIYLSTDFSVSFDFCTAATAWRKSALGWKLRAMLICRVERSAATEKGENGEPMPPFYLLVKTPAAVKISHILVYCDQHSPPSEVESRGQARRVDWCMVIIVLYGAIMLLQCILQDRRVKRWLGLGR